MFRSMSGFKAQYHGLTLLVIFEFSDWRVLLHGPDGIIHGVRQFSEETAKEHATDVARAYLHELKHEDTLGHPDLSWSPTVADDWLVWR